MPDISLLLILAIGPAIVAAGVFVRSDRFTRLVRARTVAIRTWGTDARWRGPAVCIAIGLTALGVASWSSTLDKPNDEMLGALVLIIGIPIITVLVSFFATGRAYDSAYSLGHAIAAWVAGAPWRAPATCILIGLGTLGIVTWLAKLHDERAYLLVLAPLVYLLRGLTDFTYGEESDSGPRGERDAWWTRGHY
ncbi:MAG: hypothetical protein U0031_03275 [Thermomicrobiales bacterium]